MKYRRELDNKRFAQSAGEQSNIIQLITGMQEIKLNNCEKQKRWQWERIQVKLFKISIKGMALEQLQQVALYSSARPPIIVVSFIAPHMWIDHVQGCFSDFNHAFIGFIKTQQQFYQRSLSAAAGSYNGSDFFLWYVEINVFQHIIPVSTVVTERQVFNGNIPAIG